MGTIRDSITGDVDRLALRSARSGRTRFAALSDDELRQWIEAEEAALACYRRRMIASGGRFSWRRHFVIA
jgi:hypothetical protein